MLYTLVIAIGTFPYALRAVAIPWSLDQDNNVTLTVFTVQRKFKNTIEKKGIQCVMSNGLEIRVLESMLTCDSSLVLGLNVQQWCVAVDLRMGDTDPGDLS
jgi:hypothetical protein